MREFINCLPLNIHCRHHYKQHKPTKIKKKKKNNKEEKKQHSEQHATAFSACGGPTKTTTFVNANN